MRRVEAELAQDEGGPGLEHGAEGGPQPAREAARRAAHGHPARVAGERRGERVEPRAQTGHGRRVGALLRGEDLGGALVGRADVAQHDQAGPAQAARLAHRGDRARAAVGRRRAARGDEDDGRARIDRRRDEHPGAGARRRLGGPLVRAQERQPARGGDLDDRDVAALQQPEARGQRPSQGIQGAARRRSRRPAPSAGPPASPRRRRRRGRGPAAGSRPPPARARARRRPRWRGRSP